MRLALSEQSGVRADACLPSLVENVSTLHWAGFAIYIFYFEKIRVFKAGLCYEYISME